ncbi:MAG TPA: hypothetical protein VFK10_04935, partial [Burkholderiaceae bacterium]|nr:hypothetical protein [Burkholderiaceae bacterium]
RELVKTGIAFLSTLTGIVLGLIVTSAKGSFDQRSDEVQATAAKIVLLDTQLRRLGDGASPVRALMRERLQVRIDAIWSKRGEALVGSSDEFERLQQAMQGIPAITDAHRAAVASALRLLDELSQIRSVVQVQAGSPVMMPLLLLIMFWLALILAGLNLFAPPNGTVWVTNAMVTLAAASAVFLILEMEHGFGGVVQVSDRPVREALSQMQR